MCQNKTKSFEVLAEILPKELSVKIDEIITSYQNDSSRLLNILLDTQDIIPKQYIPQDVATYISKKLNLPLSNVYSVVSFFAALSEKPRAEYVIQLCDSVVCKVRDNTLLRDTLSDLLGIKEGEGTSDGKFWLEYTPCFGACDVAPAVRINGKVYGNLTSTERVKEVLDQYK